MPVLWGAPHCSLMKEEQTLEDGCGYCPLPCVLTTLQ